MAATEDDERAALRAERTRLNEESVALERATELLSRSLDGAALRAHTERLTKHRLAEQAYHDALQDFHDRYGPVGF